MKMKKKAELIDVDPLDLPPPRVRKRHWALLGFTGLSFLGPLLYPSVSGLALHDSTAQERAIERGITTALNKTDPKVNCVSSHTLLNLDLTNIKPHEGMAVPHTGTMWMRDRLCDDLSAFQQRPLGAKDFAYPDIGQAPQDVREKVHALAVVSHEAGHIALNVTDESRTECVASQIAPDIAVAYGMDPAYKSALQRYVIGWQTEAHANTELAEYRFNLSECRDGGAGDLNPGQIGIFPTQS
jgi:hypothetical protein